MSPVTLRVAAPRRLTNHLILPLLLCVGDIWGALVASHPTVARMQSAEHVVCLAQRGCSADVFSVLTGLCGGETRASRGLLGFLWRPRGERAELKQNVRAHRGVCDDRDRRLQSSGCWVTQLPLLSCSSPWQSAPRACPWGP